MTLLGENSFLGENSLVIRVGLGKGLGLLVGLIGFFCLPLFLPNLDEYVRWGVLLWYPTLGAVVGMCGLFTEPPVLKLPLPWWFRGALVGAWLNFVLVFFAYDAMAAMMAALFGADGFLASPFWFTAEGALVGLFIDCIATRFGGEGRAVQA